MSVKKNKKIKKFSKYILNEDTRWGRNNAYFIYELYSIFSFLQVRSLKGLLQVHYVSTARKHVRRNEHRPKKSRQRLRDFSKDIYSKKCPLELTYKSFWKTLLTSLSQCFPGMIQRGSDKVSASRTKGFIIKLDSDGSSSCTV